LKCSVSNYTASAADLFSLTNHADEQVAMNEKKNT
jgi:hypothetical protein